jgi:hypothetical protein
MDIDRFMLYAVYGILATTRQTERTYREGTDKLLSYKVFKVLILYSEYVKEQTFRI